MVFQVSLKGASWKIEGCFKDVSRVFQGYFKIVPRKILKGISGVLSELQGC